MSHNNSLLVSIVAVISYLILGFVFSLNFSTLLAVMVWKLSYYILIFSGILGGILFSFLSDETLEIPHFIGNENEIKLGFLGDCLLGIAGSIVAYLLFSESLLPDYTETTQMEFNLKLSALGIIGGFGGKFLLKTALNRLMSANLKALQKEVENVEEDNALFSDVTDQIAFGLTDERLTQLKARIKNASPEKKESILARVKTIRRAKSGSKAHESKALAKNSIPILEVLCEELPNKPKYQAELGYLYVDAEEWSNAISALTRAIELAPKKGKYYLIRAFAKFQNNKGKEEVFEDLKEANNNDPSLSYEKFRNWILGNQDWLSSQNDNFSKELLDQYANKVENKKKTNQQGGESEADPLPSTSGDTTEGRSTFP